MCFLLHKHAFQQFKISLDTFVTQSKCIVDLWPSGWLSPNPSIIHHVTNVYCLYTCHSLSMPEGLAQYDGNFAKTFCQLSSMSKCYWAQCEEELVQHADLDIFGAVLACCWILCPDRGELFQIPSGMLTRHHRGTVEGGRGRGEIAAGMWLIWRAVD